MVHILKTSQIDPERFLILGTTCGKEHALLKHLRKNLTKISGKYLAKY